MREPGMFGVLSSILTRWGGWWWRACPNTSPCLGSDCIPSNPPPCFLHLPARAVGRPTTHAGLVGWKVRCVHGVTSGSSRAPGFSGRSPAISSGPHCLSFGSRDHSRNAASNRASFVHGAILRERDFLPFIPPVNSRYEAERSDSPPIGEPSIQAPFLLRGMWTNEYSYCRQCYNVQ